MVSVIRLIAVRELLFEPRQDGCPVGGILFGLWPAAAEVEKALLENSMGECKWNKTRAAEKLGITPKTLLAKLRAAGLEE